LDLPFSDSSGSTVSFSETGSVACSSKQSSPCGRPAEIFGSPSKDDVAMATSESQMTLVLSLDSFAATGHRDDGPASSTSPSSASLSPLARGSPAPKRKRADQDSIDETTEELSLSLSLSPLDCPLRASLSPSPSLHPESGPSIRDTRGTARVIRFESRKASTPSPFPNTSLLAGLDSPLSVLSDLDDIVSEYRDADTVRDDECDDEDEGTVSRAVKRTKTKASGPAKVKPKRVPKAKRPRKPKKAPQNSKQKEDIYLEAEPNNARVPLQFRDASKYRWWCAACDSKFGRWGDLEKHWHTAQMHAEYATFYFCPGDHDTYDTVGSYTHKWTLCRHIGTCTVLPREETVEKWLILAEQDPTQWTPKVRRPLLFIMTRLTVTAIGR
jgi:hypothetical protein